MCALCVLHESENCDYFATEHQLIVFYNQEVRLLHGTSSLFKYNSGNQSP